MPTRRPVTTICHRKKIARKQKDGITSIYIYKRESLSVCLSVSLSSIEMDMEALIKKPRPVLESAHQDLNNRGGLELIGHQ